MKKIAIILTVFVLILSFMGGYCVSALDGQGDTTENDMQDIEAVRWELSSRLGEIYGALKASDYTPEKYAIIKKYYKDAMNELSKSDSVIQMNAVFERAYAEIVGVSSIFEDTAVECIAKIRSVYEIARSISDRYSKAEFERLTQIYLCALDSIEESEASFGTEKLYDISESAVREMSAIKTDWTSTGEISARSVENADYPAGYNIEQNGFWGVLESSDGLLFDAALSIVPMKEEGLHKEMLKKAVKDNLVSYVGDLPISDEKIAEILKGSEIKGLFDIKLIRSGKIFDELSGEYTVCILLPKDIRTERGLKVVCLNDDGSAEYHDARRVGNSLVFSTEHLSEFLIVGEKNSNFMPVIIGVCLLAMIVIMLVAVLIVRRRRRLYRRFYSNTTLDIEKL